MGQINEKIRDGNRQIYGRTDRRAIPITLPIRTAAEKNVQNAQLKTCKRNAKRFNN